MAVFGSDLAFNINTINFNTPFQGPYALSSSSGNTIGGSLPPVPIGTETYPLPPFSLTYDEALHVGWDGTRSNTLLGIDLSYSMDGTAQIYGGTALSVSSFVGDATAFGFVGIALSASEFGAAMHSASTTDDQAFVTKILAGNDLIILSGFNDVFTAGLGRDFIADQGGSDRINAGGGNDLVVAGKGNDKVDASLGSDVVLGGAGNDVIDGGVGSDVIWAGTGSDSVTGGLGADLFLFKSGDGTAVISDFNAADDQLLLMGPASGLANLTIVKEGGNVRVSFSDVSVLLLGKTLAQVSVADITVGGNLALNAATAAFFDGWDYA